MRDELYSSSKNQMNILIEKGLKKSLQNSFESYEYIPVEFLNEEIYNPVVKRSVNQSIRIVNVIMKKHGDLEAIIIEMPRETNEKEERKKLNDIQKQNEKEKNGAINRARNEYGFTEKQLYSQKDLITKIRLWYQQDGRCVYTGKVISVEDLINNPNGFEIEHIIPKSISLDDSLNNKVLVYPHANQVKGQRTPFGAFCLASKDANYEDIKLRASKLLENKKISKTKYDLNKATVRIKYSHKIDTKVNRTIADATLYSTREVNGEDYIVRKYKNIYDNKVAESVIKLVKTDLKNFEYSSKSKILMRKHDPRTFEELVKFIQLQNYMAEVEPGDISNREGHAAKVYFNTMFGKDFSRSYDCVENAMLNYGYAIIRAYITRSIVSYGYNPSLGVFHKSEYNAFCLADDFLEIFRPVVDAYVVNYLLESDKDVGFLSQEVRAYLIGILSLRVRFDNQYQKLSTVIDKFVLQCFDYLDPDEKNKKEISNFEINTIEGIEK